MKSKKVDKEKMRDGVEARAKRPLSIGRQTIQLNGVELQWLPREKITRAQCVWRLKSARTPASEVNSKWW